MSRQLRALGLVVLVLISLPAVAVEGYRNEVGHTRTNLTYEGDDEVTSTLTFFEYYIHPVFLNQETPRQEAAFLQRSGSVGIALGNTDASGTSDASTKDEGAQVTLAESGKPWVLQWRYLKLKGDASSPFSTDIKSESTRYRIGYYVRDGILFSVTQTQSDLNFSAPTGNDTKVTRFEYALKWVKIRSANTATNIELSVENEREKDSSGSRNGQVISLSGDYYFSPDVSLGVLYSQISHDDKDAEGTRTELRGSYFFTPRFFAGVTLERFQASHSSGVDEETRDMFVGYRF